MILHSLSLYIKYVPLGVTSIMYCSMCNLVYLREFPSFYCYYTNYVTFKLFVLFVELYMNNSLITLYAGYYVMLKVFL